MAMVIRTLDELAAEAERLSATLAPREGGATLVTLAGELGAGKTAFTQALAKALGVTDAITSPTFVLEKVYALPHESGSRKPRFERLVHIDAYRLPSGGDPVPLGFDTLMQDAGNLVVLEWPERVSEALPGAVARIALQLNADGSRTLSY